MVQNALRSIRNLSYSNWELAFIDDGIQHPGKPIVESLLPEYLNKVKFYSSGHSPAVKTENGGSHLGRLMNEAIQESSCDYGIMLCDDDALFPDYLANLNTWFKKHSEKKYCYSNVLFFDPFVETPESLLPRDYIQYGEDKINRTKNFLNKGGKTVRPHNCLDASQVAWSLSIQKDHNIWFTFPLTKNLDAAFYKKIGENFGYCQYTGFLGQYKGYYPSNLTSRKQVYAITDIPNGPKIEPELTNLDQTYFHKT